jgi:hypothetical protein
LASWSRPRDLSHWEQFEHYHDTFYRHVETQSVTPFAPRALDRGATGVLVSLLRGGVDAWATDRGLQQVNDAAKRALLDEAVATFRRRAEAAHAIPSQVEAAEHAAVRRRDDLISRLTTATARYAWRARGEGAKKEDWVTLLHGAEEANGRPPWVMPNSLRNTEPGINVLIDRQAAAPPEPAWDFSSRDTGGAPPPGTATADATDDDESDSDAGDPAWQGEVA